MKHLKKLTQEFSNTVTSLIGETEHYIQQNFQQQGGRAIYKEFQNMNDNYMNV